MPRRRESSSPVEEVEYERHRKHRRRSSSVPKKEDHRTTRKHKHKHRSRSRSESLEREHNSQSHRNKHKKHKHHHHQREDNHQYDPHRRIKQERQDDDYSQPQNHHNHDYQRRIKQEREDDNLSQQRRDRRQNDNRRNRAHQQRVEEGVDMNFGRPDQNSQEIQHQEKDKPDFKLSGKLKEDTNTFRGVVVHYNEPPEARKPKKKWRLYPFKGDKDLPVLHIHRQSAYLIGRDRRVADIPVDHPSCSKQHAALQYRLIEFRRDDGSRGMKVKPYVIDLNSSNGTYVNNEKIEGQRYVELFEKDVVKFGYSSREYVILHDKVDTSELADEEAESN